MPRFKILVLSSIISCTICSMEESNERRLVDQPSSVSTDEQAPAMLTPWQKTRSCLFRWCWPKVLKVVVGSYWCGKSCTETVKTFNEYKMITSMAPVIASPYCWGATACLACAGGACLLYRTNQLPCAPPLMLYSTDNH
jgi:hypothetical protein